MNLLRIGNVYTAEKKERILARVRAGESIRSVAREEGVSDSTIRYWIRNSDPNNGTPKPAPDSALPENSAGAAPENRAEAEPEQIAAEEELAGAEPPAAPAPAPQIASLPPPSQAEREEAVLAYTGLRTLVCAAISEFVPFDPPPPNPHVLTVIRTYPRETRRVIERITGGGDPEKAVIVAFVIDGLAIGLAALRARKKSRDSSSDRLPGIGKDDGASPAGA